MKREEQVKKKSKSEKNKPLEFSCKRPVPVPKPKRQGMIKRQEEIPMDPRFNREVAGDYSASRFGEDYSFLNDYREEEKKEILTKLKNKKTSYDDKQTLDLVLKRMQSQDAARKRITIETEVREELRQKEMEMVAATGKKAYYHPRSAVKKLIAERHEEGLKKSGQLDKFKAKKERREISKEKVNIPRTRRVIEVPN